MFSSPFRVLLFAPLNSICGRMGENLTRLVCGVTGHFAKNSRAGDGMGKREGGCSKVGGRSGCVASRMNGQKEGERGGKER